MNSETQKNKEKTNGNSEIENNKDNTNRIFDREKVRLENSDFTVKRRDVIILSVLLVVIVVVALAYYFLKQNGNYAKITVDGELYGTYSLSENQEIQIKDSDGNVTNEAEIKDGKIFMKEADCPDKLCIKQGKKHDANSEIVCLPNRVVISVKSDDTDSEFDTFSQ